MVENTAALTNKTTLEGTLTSDEAYPYPPEPTYKVSLEGEENERVAVVRQQEPLVVSAQKDLSEDLSAAAQDEDEERMESIFSGAKKADRFDELFGNKALAEPSKQAEDLLWPEAPSRNKDTQPSHPSSYRFTLSPDSGLDFGRTRQEEDVIKAKEAELLRKAKQLEEEMMQVR